ncbi:hypothetical protein D5272_01680 [bacterium D16-76]|nr:hypothetical protein [bacterium D16-76]
MKQYKEIRKFEPAPFASFALIKPGYIRGDNDEYGHLLFDLADKKDNLSTMDIIEIAKDIMEHSNISSDYRVEDAAFEVARIADVFFEEV